MSKKSRLRRRHDAEDAVATTSATVSPLSASKRILPVTGSSELDPDGDLVLVLSGGSVVAEGVESGAQHTNGMTFITSVALIKILQIYNLVE